MSTTILLRTWVNDNRRTQIEIGDEVMIENFTTKRTGSEGCQHVIAQIDADELTVTLKIIGGGTEKIQRNELSSQYAFFRKI
jgi:hypothetical protein